MTPRRAVQTYIAKTVFVPNKGPLVVDIDRVRLLTDLLTFDEVVLHSSQFGEIPFLVNLLGFDGFQDLLKRKVIRLTSETSGLGLTSTVNGRRELPLNHFPQLFFAQRGNAEQCEHALLQVSGLKRQKREELVELIVAGDIHTPESFGRNLHEQIRKDLSSNRSLVDAVLSRIEPRLDAQQVELKTVTKQGPRGHESLEIQTNLRDLSSLSMDREHEIVSDLYAKIGNLNLSLAKIGVLNAIAAFDESDAPFLFGKLYDIVGPPNPQIEQDAFLRVLGFTSIPEALDSKKIDVEKLLRVRETAECREFRTWLNSIDQMSEAELKRLLTGFKARAAAFLASTSGKAVRFAVNTGIGLIPGVSLLVPVSEGIVDTFLLDRLLPSSGILSFLNSSIPRILS